MTERLYIRTLPGGGYVAIDVTREHRWLRRPRYHGAVVVERRTDGAHHRRLHPVIVAVATDSSAEAVLHQLLPAAEFNPAIGSALLRCTPGTVPARRAEVRRPRLAHNVPG